MKKITAMLAAVMLLGAGCLPTMAPKEVSGPWHLAFDLPADWVTVAAYQEPNTEATTLNSSVNRTTSEIVLQTPNKPIVAGGIAPDASVPADSYTKDHFTKISVTRLDPRRIIPSEAEDLGDGFYKVEMCEANGDCTLGGRLNYDYYYKTDSANYKFIILNRDLDVATAETIVRSAKEVTQFTDAPTIKVETE